MDQTILQKTPEQIILFLQKETPEVIQQLFLWDFISTLIWFVIGATLLTSFWIIISRRVKVGLPKEPSYKGGTDIFQETWSHDAYGDIKTDIEGFCWIGGFLIHLLSLLIMSVSTGWLKILITPKLYLFEYAVSIVK